MHHLPNDRSHVLIGVPNELVIIDGGDRSLSRAAYRNTLYTKLETFFAAQIGGN